MSASTTATDAPPRFERSAVPKKNPLGEGKYVKTAACLIIGDEVLNGKTKDTNSNFFAKFCFDLGIELKRIEVIADDEDEIAEAARRMVQNYDFVVTSGGIGPTHDDITYESLAKAFDQMPLEYNEETLRRMGVMISHRYKELGEQTGEQATARKRMALFPKNAEVLFVSPELWVPVVRLRGKLCILPGVPSLFTRLLTDLTPYIPLQPGGMKPFRRLIHTDLPESNIAPFLGALQERVKKEGVRVGSYPKMYRGVEVSLIGHNDERLRELEAEVVKELNGIVVAAGKVGEEKAAH